jgi:hypothetical protein
MSDTIGDELNSSVAMAVVGGMKSLANWRCTCSIAAIGAAHGHAFRAVELAYDMGHRHAGATSPPLNQDTTAAVLRLLHEHAAKAREER